MHLSREAALAAGDTYYQGARGACGHDGTRYVSTYGCVACVRRYSIERDTPAYRRAKAARRKELDKAARADPKRAERMRDKGRERARRYAERIRRGFPHPKQRAARAAILRRAALADKLVALGFDVASAAALAQRG